MKYLPFPEKRYSIIYADPPWEYERRMKGENKLIWDNGAVSHYPTLSFENLSKLPVKEIASEDCLVFLWVISPRLDECIDVGKSWGFEFITVGFVWNKSATPLAGNYTMAQTEFCLIFKRGKIPQPRGARNVRQLLIEREPIFVTVKRGKHSVKPLQIKCLISEMFPEQLKIELFARPGPLFSDPGWDHWGNEVVNGGYSDGS